MSSIRDAPQFPNKMASRGGTCSASHHISPPRCGPDTSFSIRRILDLSDKRTEDCSHSTGKRSPADSCPQALKLPIVPRVVRPIIHNYAENVPHTGLINWQDFGPMHYSHHWSCGLFPFREQGHPLGKSFNST